MQKIYSILLQVLPIVLMVLLIPIVKNDYLLSLIYIFITAASFAIELKEKELVIYAVGFLGMIASEYFFISTGVEVFQRHSLFGLMPLWLPFLWAYGFVVIKRAVLILLS